MAGTIKIQDLANAMNKNPKELLFELQSIGVKVQSVDDVIPPEVVQALISGKPLEAPNQVIIREDRGRERKVKKTLKTRIPRVKVLTQKDIPVIDIPKKSTLQEVEEMIPASEPEAPPVQEVPVKEEAPAPSRPARPAKPSKKVIKVPPKEEAAPSNLPKLAEIQVKRRPPQPKPAAKPAKPPESKPAPKTAAKAGTTQPGRAKPVRPPKGPAPREATETTETKETKKTVKKKTDKRKAKTTPDPTTTERVDVRKFVGSSAETARRLQEAEEQRSARLRSKKRKVEEEEVEIHVPLTLDEQVARLKSMIPEDHEVTLTEGATLRDLIDRLGVKVKDFMPYLFQKGIILSVNQPVREEFVKKLGEDLGFTYTTQTFEEKVASDVQKRQKPKEGTARAAVVTVMGHVDHGKTSILDYIRKTRVAAGEAGGITQHIGAYQVFVGDKKIVFIDTPGHEAFTHMRSRGSKITDIVVLVVAADDGVMPQTLEAINHAKAADVPIIVAVNKIDKANADPDKVKKQLGDRGLLAEDWGGDTIVVPLSAVTGAGIDTLLEMILLVAEMQELKSNSTIPAKGTILEARKETGRGMVATVLVQEGTLNRSDYFICGNTYGKIRSMYDDRGNQVKSADPSTPVEINGFSTLPSPGDLFQVVANEKEAKRIVELRRQSAKDDQARKTTVSLEDFFSTVQGDEKKVLRFVVKADVTGTLEVVKSVIESKSTEDVDVVVMHEGAGTITVNDVALAQASRAVVIGFNVKPEKMAQKEAEVLGVEIRHYSIIYDLIEDIEAAVTGAVVPETREIVTGTAQVLKVIRIPKVGSIAGCMVNEGIIKRGSQVRILRDNTLVRAAKIVSLKRFTEDVTEVRKGFECGIGVDRSKDVQEGDILECFERVTAED